MDKLGEYILRRIADGAARSAELGAARYESFFVGTRLYKALRGPVDAALRDAGHGDVISRK